MSKSDFQAIDHSASIRHKLLEGETSSWKRYALLVIGEVSVWKLIKYELIVLLFGSLPGALGLALRQVFYPRLFKKVGRGVVFGRNLVIRNASKIEIGNNVMIDDQALIDARGAGEDGIVIGDNVILNREVVLICKVGGIHIGSNTDVGLRSFLISTGGIRIGSNVGLAGECKLGGSMSQLEQEKDEGEDQEPDGNWQVHKYSKGPIVIGDQCTVYMQSIILDGVTIGARSLIGANLVLREDVPEETVVAAHQKLVSLPLNSAKAKKASTKTTSADALSLPKNPEPEADLARTEADAPAKIVKQDSRVRQLVVSAVYAAIDEVNLLRGPEHQLVKNPDGDLSELDSMDLVNLIVESEQQVEDLLGFSINLNTEATTTGREAFKTLQTFIDEVQTIVAKY